MSVRAIDYEALGHPIRGPRALTDNWPRFWHLTYNIAVMQWKMRFFGSALGYLWQLMKPLLLFGVIYFVLSHSKFGKGHLPFFPASLLLGIVLFGFFSEATGGAVTCMVNRENLVRKIEFPRLAVPLSIALTAMMNLGLNLIPVLIFLLAAGARPTLNWLLMPVVVLLLGLLATGLGMVLSVGYVRYRDVKPIWEVVLQMTFYASGIFIALDELGHATVLGVRVNVYHLLLANPFAALLQEARHVFINHAYPSAASAIGGTKFLMIPLGIGLVVLIGGFFLFDHEAPRVAEQL